jgi:hypothetical protein
MYLYITSYQGNREVMNSKKEIYSTEVYSCMSRNCSAIGSPAMALVNGRILSKVLKDVKLQAHQLCIVGLKLWTIHQECLVPVLKVCYSRYCSWFAEIGPVFKLTLGI